MSESFNYDEMLAAQGYEAPTADDPTQDTPASSPSSTLEKTKDWIKANPYPSVGIAAAAVYLATRGR